MRSIRRLDGEVVNGGDEQVVAPVSFVARHQVLGHVQLLRSLALAIVICTYLNSVVSLSPQPALQNMGQLMAFLRFRQ
jgi:hypothetical protein